MTSEKPNLFDTIDTLLDQQLLTAAATLMGNASKVAIPFLMLGLTFYLGVNIAKLILSPSESDLHNIFITTLRWVIVFSVVSAGALFSIELKDLVITDVPAFFSAAFGGDSAVSVAGAIYEQASLLAEKIKEKAGMFDVGLHLLALCVYIFFLPAAAIVFVLSIVARIGLTILAILAPIFISFAAFPATRGLFQSWLNQVLNFALYLSLYLLISSLAITILDQIVEQNQGNPLAAILIMCVLMVVLCFVFLQVPTIARDLTNSGFQAFTGQRVTAQAARMGAKAAATGYRRARSAGSYIRSKFM